MILPLHPPYHFRDSTPRKFFLSIPLVKGDKMETRTIRITENDLKKLRVEKLLCQPEADGVFD
jgi:hypothetical protein